MTSKGRIKNYLGRNFNKKRSPDSLSKKKRSFLMSKIRSRGTVFEKSFIIALKRFTKSQMRLNVVKVLGKPDIVFMKEGVCVFLDSDFWHGWQYPRWKNLLKDNFWRNKIESNRERDKKVTRSLRAQGWYVIRIWEHNLRLYSDWAIDKVLVALSVRKNFK